MNRFMGYNIIGDIHGMNAWKSLVKDDYINVFVGDFFDPYTPYSIPYEKCIANFKEIIEYKKKHPETIILWGNHELHYLLLDKMDERYSRFDEEHAAEIQQLLLDNYAFFNGIAYCINDIYLVTHAGISRYWYLVHFGEYNGQSPSEIATKINDLWEKDYHPFLVRENKQYDGTAEGPTQSPLWIRSYILDRYNLYEGTPYKQVFGHTICRQIKEKDGLICIDCLRWMDHFEPGIATLFINN